MARAHDCVLLRQIHQRALMKGRHSEEILLTLSPPRGAESGSRRPERLWWLWSSNLRAHVRRCAHTRPAQSAESVRKLGAQESAHHSSVHTQARAPPFQHFSSADRPAFPPVDAREQRSWLCKYRAARRGLFCTLSPVCRRTAWLFSVHGSSSCSVDCLHCLVAHVESFSGLCSCAGSACVLVLCVHCRTDIYHRLPLKFAKHVVCSAAGFFSRKQPHLTQALRLGRAAAGTSLCSPRVALNLGGDCQGRWGWNGGGRRSSRAFGEDSSVCDCLGFLVWNSPVLRRSSSPFCWNGDGRPACVSSWRGYQVVPLRIGVLCFSNLLMPEFLGEAMRERGNRGRRQQGIR